jgi:hypothetical protein
MGHVEVWLFLLAPVVRALPLVHNVEHTRAPVIRTSNAL